MDVKLGLLKSVHANVYIKWLLLILIACINFGSVYLAIRFRILPLLGTPFLFLLLLQSIVNLRTIFFLLIASIPFSFMFQIGSLSLDVLSEPLMIFLLFIFIIILLSGQYKLQGNKIYPFHIFIFLIIYWIIFCTINSEVPYRSIKFLLAKCWYLASLVFIAEFVIRKPQDIKHIFWAFFLSLLAVMVIITIWHSAEGFSFESSHTIVFPFFWNGVIYGATLALFLPFAWNALSWYKPMKLEWTILWIGIIFMILGAFLSYKRGAWLATLSLPIIGWFVYHKWFDKIVYVTIIISIIGLSYLLKDNNFYKFAPEYDQTIYHHGNLEGHLQATFQGTELSTMERFYRWVAAKNMIYERPFTGFGPNTFNLVYKQYADDAFRTYVSDNDEQSTTHNYFLMTFSEQGIIGGLLFLGFCLYMLLKAYYLFHRTQNKFNKRLVLACLLSLSTIIFHSLLNEMIEVDKVGGMFWLIGTMIHKIEVWEDEITIK